MWHLYIIECSNGAYYTGITEDLDRRLAEHRRGASRYTRAYPMKQLLHVETFDTRNDAEKREAQIKRWSRAKKEALASSNAALLHRLSKSRD